jgi:hypothetical protein
VIEAAVAFVVSDVPVEQAVQTVRRKMQRSILLLDDIIRGVMVLLPIRDWPQTKFEPCLSFALVQFEIPPHFRGLGFQTAPVPLVL